MPASDRSFEKLSVSEVHNGFVKNRISAIKAYSTAGFVIESEENEMMRLRITKE